MKSREVVQLFFLTLFVGGVSTVLTSFFFRWNEYILLTRNGEIIQLLSLMVWFTCVGFMFSLVSQMGFFVFLTVRRLGISFFKTKELWSIVQVVLIILSLGDFLFFQSILKSEYSMAEQIIPIVTLVGFSILIAYIKVRQTNKLAFIPSIFFMIVISLIEWIPAIQAENNESWLNFMLIPLVICNGYQLFMLTYLQKQSYTAPSNTV